MSSIVGYGNTPNSAPVSALVRSRGIQGAPTIVQSGDNLGAISASGWDGDEAAKSATIEFEVDGTPGNNDMPGRILFRTALDGTKTALERMRINNAGNVGIGTTNPAAKLHVTGGQIVGAFLASASGTINWDNGNIQSTSVPAGTITFPTGTLIDGGSYTLILNNATGGTYTLSSVDIATWKCNPVCGSNQVTVTAGKDTVLSIVKAGTTAYVSWIDGF